MKFRPAGLLLSLIFIPLGLVINAVVFAALLAAQTLGRLAGHRTHKAEPVSKLEASVVIPSWNGRELLTQCLPALYRALECTDGEHEVIVVDNGSSDDSAAYVRDNFPAVRVLVSAENLGFGQAVNLGLQAAGKDIIVLLNNDMVVDQGFLTPLLEEFAANPLLFAASSQIYSADADKARQETGKTGAYLRHGSIYPYHEHNFPAQAILPATYAGGGSGAFDRSKVLELGGFDSLYHPFYVEDLDLSFRAWRRGWKVVIKPASIVYHKHRGTIGARFAPVYIQSVLRKNEILFVWKNISGVTNLTRHFAWLWLRLVYRTAKGSWEIPLAYAKALAQIHLALRRRLEETRAAVRTEAEVFLISTSLSAYRAAFGPRKSAVPGQPLRILIVCPYIPYPPSHGGAVRMYNILKQLSRRHEVYLLSFVEDEAELAGEEHLKSLCRQVHLLRRRETPRLDNMLWLRPQSSLNEFYSAEFENAMLQMVDENDIDIVQYEYTQMAQYLRKFPRAKTVLTEHDVNFITRCRYFQMQPWGREKVKALLRWTTMLVWELDVARRFDLVCSVSSHDKELLLTYDRRLKVSDAAPTGTDTSYYTPANRTAVEENSLLFIGFFKHIPNVEGILRFCREVYPGVKDKLPGVKVYIVGANPPPEVKALAQDPSIKVLGFVEDLREYYAKAAVFIVPIYRGAGTRVKIYEGMAAGIPIVSTRLGAEGIAVTHCQNIWLADDAEQFAAGIWELLTKPAFGAELAYRARELVVKNYDWENIACRLAEEYYSLWQEAVEC